MTDPMPDEIIAVLRGRYDNFYSDSFGQVWKYKNVDLKETEDDIEPNAVYIRKDTASQTVDIAKSKEPKKAADDEYVRAWKTGWNNAIDHISEKYNVVKKGATDDAR